MPLTAIAYLCLSGLAFVASVMVHPEWGLYGYLSTYNMNPLQQWWGPFLPQLVRRYAMFFALAIAGGMVLQGRKLKCPEAFSSQEGLLVTFVGMCWLSTLLSPAFHVDELQWKMLKVAAVLLMAARVITTRTLFQRTIFTLIIVGGYLGYSLYSGVGGYIGSRFDRGIGGSDFAEGNFLAAHFGYLLPLVGVRYLIGGKKDKIVSALSAAFMVNGIVIARSRGTFLALTLGTATTLWLLPRLRSYRKHILGALIVGLLAALSLTDQQFWERMATLRSDEVSHDASAQGRIEAWKLAIRMWSDHPLGVGVGQYKYYAGLYDPTRVGRDTHNTYLRCLAETGAQGLVVLMLLIVFSFKLLKTIEKEAAELEATARSFYEMHAFGLRISLIVYLTAAFFISSVYVEELYWILMLPLFLKRALKNEEAKVNSRKIYTDQI